MTILRLGNRERIQDETTDQPGHANLGSPWLKLDAMACALEEPCSAVTGAVQEKEVRTTALIVQPFSLHKQQLQICFSSSAGDDAGASDDCLPTAMQAGTVTGNTADAGIRPLLPDIMTFASCSCDSRASSERIPPLTLCPHDARESRRTDWSQHGVSPTASPPMPP